jgi:HSP20 family protein
MGNLEKLGPARADDVCELLITADLPGFDEENVEVTVSSDVLTIRAQKKVQHEENGDEGRYRECRIESRSRSIRLPFEVSEEEISADLDDGVLTVCVRKPPKATDLEKAPQAQQTVRRIEVKGSSHQGISQDDVKSG